MPDMMPFVQILQICPANQGVVSPRRYLKQRILFLQVEGCRVPQVFCIRLAFSVSPIDFEQVYLLGASFEFPRCLRFEL